MLTAILDLIFPPSADARIVKAATVEQFLLEYRPRGALGGAGALSSYQSPLIRAAIHEAKFYRNQKAMTLLGALLARHLATREEREHHLAPIPLSRNRLRERGYNQVLEIVHAARRAGGVDAIHIHDTLLIKVRHTPPQTSLSRAERLGNLAAAFALGAKAAALHPNTPFILLDDVTTTGATLAEAAKTLRKAGFTRIEQLALAH